MEALLAYLVGLPALCLGTFAVLIVLGVIGFLAAKAVGLVD